MARVQHRIEASRRRQAITPRTVAIVAYPGVEALDVTGPAAVFSGANWLAGRQNPGATLPYRIVLLAAARGELPTSDGIRLVADGGYGDLRGTIDTLLIAGSPDIERCIADRRLIGAARRLAARARRVGSVCTGAFVLAAAGLLDGRRATTHWAFAERFAALFPKVRVDAEPIFIRDGRYCSSAGVSAGMDLSLALVEEDCGRELALEVARGLVLYLRRPGGQAQFSGLLAAQTTAHDAIGELQVWMAEHPEADLSVAALAGRVAMSPRNFARVFRRAAGVTPARFAERVRVEAARRRLEQTTASVKSIAADCGFGSSEALRIAFLRTVRISPAAYRERFRPPA